MAAKEKKSRRKLKTGRTGKAEERNRQRRHDPVYPCCLTCGRWDRLLCKIVRPKQQAEDDVEFEDDGYGEGFDPDEAYGEPEYLSEDDFDDKDSK